MASTKFICESPESFDSSLASAVEASTASGSPLFLLFTGSVVPETGRSWCPDCVAADPVIERALQGLEGGHVLLECPVKREEYRGNADYLYRKNWVKLACVPTLIKYEGGRAVKRLNDSQSQDSELVSELVSSP